MRKKFLLCPQCGSCLFYVKDESEQNLYFYVEQSGLILPTKEVYNKVKEAKVETLYCTDCSWSGRISKLKKYFT